MIKIKKNFKIDIGFSDHTDGYEAAIAAATLGATTIEKHLTINTNMKGPDHSSSLNVKQFSEFVKSIRNTEKIILNNHNKISFDEFQKFKNCRKSIVAKTKIKKVRDLQEVILQPKGQTMVYQQVIGLKC